jgi:glycosyltransferase involved in cell wall biosynthesis
VYNVEAYLHQCLESVYAQEVNGIEVICVNDGSTDGSRAIIQEFKDKYPDMIVVDRENGGLSVARNSGLISSNGEYIVFLDGDDWLRNDALEKLYKKAKVENLDVLIADTLFYYSEETTDWIYKRPRHFETLGIKNGIDYFIELKKNNCYAPMAYNQIYKREFLSKNKLSFYHGLLNEDELWTPQVFCNAQRVNCMELPFYYYRRRNNSIMSSVISSRKIQNNLFIAGELINLSKTYSNTELTGWIWVKAYELYYRAITEYKANKADLKSVRNLYYSSSNLLNSKINYLQFDICLKYLRKSFSFNLSVWLLVFLRKIQRNISKLIK